MILQDSSGNDLYALTDQDLVTVNTTTGMNINAPVYNSEGTSTDNFSATTYCVSAIR
jgi:hypothetical protein